MLRAVGGGLILSDGARGGDLDLIHADDRDMGDEASLERGWYWVPRACRLRLRSQRKSARHSSGAGEKFSSAPEIAHYRVPQFFAFALRSNGLHGAPGWPILGRESRR